MIEQFFKPTSLEEALLIKEKFGDAVTWFAGGAHFNHVSFQARYDKVIGLEGLGLHAIHSKDGLTSIGATVTLQKLIDNSLIPKPLRKAASQTATRTIRNMATVGGDIAIGGKKSGLTPCLIAMKAHVVTSDKQHQPVEEFIASGSRELILKITLPEQKAYCCIKQYQPKANATALIRVAVSFSPASEQEPGATIVAIGAIEDSPRRLQEVEHLVSGGGNFDRSTLEQTVAAIVQPTEDIQGSVAFKRYIAGITVADCIMSCLEKR